MADNVAETVAVPEVTETDSAPVTKTPEKVVPVIASPVKKVLEENTEETENGKEVEETTEETTETEETPKLNGTNGNHVEEQETKETKNGESNGAEKRPADETDSPVKKAKVDDETEPIVPAENTEEATA